MIKVKSTAYVDNVYVVPITNNDKNHCTVAWFYNNMVASDDILLSDSLYINWTKLVCWERLLFNDNSAIFQLYHGKSENKLILNEMMTRSALY